jgi:hypothetical protein
MIDFGSLMEGEFKEPVVKKQVSKTIDLSKELGVKKKLSPTEAKALKEELHKIEPGYKVPIANYKQIGQYCEYCDDVTAQVLNEAGTRLRCLICKQDKYLKK